MEDEKKSCTEEFRVSGEQLVDEVKKIIHEGNVRHIVVKNESGQTVIEIPVGLGVVGAILLPFFAAVAAIAVLAANYTIVVTREEPTVSP